MRLPVPGTGMRTGMTARAATACPGGAGLRCCRHGHVLPGQDRPTLRPRPAVSGRPVWPGPRRAVIALALPSQSTPAHCLWVSVFPALSTTNYYEINIRSMFGPIYRELQRGMWTNLSFLSMHRVCITISQVGVPLWARPDGWIPSISTGCAQARDRYAQDIHMLCTQSLLLRSGLPDLWPADPAVQALLVRRRGTQSCRGVHRWPGVGSRTWPLPRSRSVDQTIPRSATVFGQTGRILQARGHDRGTSHCEHPRAIGEQALWWRARRRSH